MQPPDRRVVFGAREQRTAVGLVEVGPRRSRLVEELGNQHHRRLLSIITRQKPRSRHSKCLVMIDRQEMPLCTDRMAGTPTTRPPPAERGVREDLPYFLLARS